MDAEQYISEIVEPTIADFASNPASRRHAFLACVATFHAIDYISTSRSEKNNRRFRFRKTSREYAIVDRVAHAFKHLRTGHEDAADNRPLESKDVISRPPAFYGRAVWGLSRWGDTQGGVTLNSERDVDLLSTVKVAVKFIRQQSGLRQAV